jgi:sialic acid synthase SpsE
VGLSDHARNTAAIPIIVALGASLYERHLMAAGGEGVDAAVSSSPDELADAIATAERTQQALGHGRKECLPAEAANVIPSRRALHASRALAAGHVVRDDDVTALRPSSGLAPDLEKDLAGSVLGRSVEEGAPFFDADLVFDRRRRGVA